jgi:sulfotransferase family protein
MRLATIFVLSDVRSGSTLLDQCLGGHPSIVPLGEVHWLTTYLSQDRGLYNPAHPLQCSCGKPVRHCAFWNDVEQSLGRPLTLLRLRQSLKRSSREHKLLSTMRYLPRRLVKNRPRLYRFWPIRFMFDGQRLARDCVALYDAVAAATGRPYCVDSSKSPFRFYDVYRQDPKRTIAIALARDYRAVVHSKMKRGQSMRSAAAGWRRKMLQIESLTRDLPAGSVFRLKYESLCMNPRHELERVCGFLGIEFNVAMLQPSTENLHHIGGSPSKFDPARMKISIDRSHEDKFDPSALRLMRQLVGEIADRWGY